MAGGEGDQFETERADGAGQTRAVQQPVDRRLGFEGGLFVGQGMDGSEGVAAAFGARSARRGARVRRYAPG